MTPAEYWRTGAGLKNITPRGKAWPEGEGFGAFLLDLVGDDHLLEFGCGTGRLAVLFAPDRYTGVDICAGALARAGVTLPDHRFVLIGEHAPLPVADVTLFHTVLLHIPDDELHAVVERIHSRRVIVSEVCGRHWRRDGLPPVFNREPAEYAATFAPRYRLMQVRTRPYPHYVNTDLTVMEFERC